MTKLIFLAKSIFKKLRKKKQCFSIKGLDYFKDKIREGIDVKWLKKKKRDLKHIPKYNCWKGPILFSKCMSSYI